MSKLKSKTTQTDKLPHDRSCSPRSAELLLVAVIVMGGAALRVWQPDHLAVEHFDEGVYASNLFCSLNGNAYPARHLYAPPLLPALLEWSLIFSGIAAASVMWVNVIAGCVMVPSVWWVSRTWFGPIAGLTAAAFAALSPIHIQYSRAALTDGLLCLWMLWGVYWAWRAILTGRPSAIILAGLFACLAWWTKYNGWLTLAISGAGMAAWLIVPPLLPARLAAGLKPATNTSNDRRMGAADHDEPSLLTAMSSLARWGLVGLIACVGWMPVVIGLQDVGGYGAVSTNHSRYFVGIAGWAGSFARQADNLAHYHGGLTLLALLTVVIATSLLKPLQTSARTIARDRMLAAWMMAAWFIGLFVAVPLYSPYPRLTLPWVVAAWMVAGVILSCVLRLVPSEITHRSASAFRWGAAGLLLVMAILLQGVADQSNHVIADRRGLQVIAKEILDWIGSDSDAVRNDEAIVLRVVGEPGLFFQLAAEASHRAGLSGRLFVVPAADYGLESTHAGENVRMFVVAGPHAPLLGDVSPEAREHLSLQGEWGYRPSDLVLLDEVGPQALRDRRTSPAQPVRLYGVAR